MSAITTRGRAMPRVKLATEDDRADDRASAQERDAVGVARPVVKRAAGDERSGGAAAEVDRALGPKVGHELGQFAERQAGVADRAPVRDDREQAIAADADRRTRMAAGGDVAVELRAAGREALRIARERTGRARGVRLADDRPAIRDEHRTGLQQITARRARQRAARRDLDVLADDRDARA